jgi:hypothetical protein
LVSSESEVTAKCSFNRGIKNVYYDNDKHDNSVEMTLVKVKYTYHACVRQKESWGPTKNEINTLRNTLLFLVIMIQEKNCVFFLNRQPRHYRRMPRGCEASAKKVLLRFCVARKTHHKRWCSAPF